jgi:hypothetical protein
MSNEPQTVRVQAGADILIYKDGVTDTQDYGSFVFKAGKETRSEKPVILEQTFEPVYGLDKIKSSTPGFDSELNYDRLKSVLKKYTEYPDKYRTIIWKYLLSLPMKKTLFESYIKGDIHPAFKDLYKTYQVKSYRMYNKLARVCSALAHWSPLFAEISYLPDLVFPFVKTIKHDDLVLFEVVMSFLIQHCQLWFEKFPSDPVHILRTSIDVIIAKESIILYKHFQKIGFGVAEYAWPLLKNAFSVVLRKEDWLKLFDHLFTHHNKPELLLYFTAAYLLHFKGTLSKMSSIEDLYEFTETQNAVNMKMVLKNMFRLYKKYQDDEDVNMGVFGNYLPIDAKRDYPVVLNYPTENVAKAKHIR